MIPRGVQDYNFDKVCDKPKKYNFEDLTKDNALKLASHIQKFENIVSDKDENGVYHYSHPFCTDVYCAYKDKCKRTKKNLNNLRDEVDNNESSTKFLNALDNLVCSTNNLEQLKLIEEETQMCGLLRSLYDEFCKTESYKIYLQPTSIIDNQVVVGDKGHANQHKRLKDISIKASQKIKSLNVNNIQIKASKGVVKSFLSDKKQRKNSSVYNSIKKSEAKRKNRKKSGKT
jgi:hypothetical protein